MAVHLKFKDSVDPRRRDAALAALSKAGFAAEQLFPDQTRPRLASIYSIESAGPADIRRVRKALEPHAQAIEFVEAPPTDRKPI